MADKTTYIQEQISKQLQLWIARALILGAVLFPLLGIMDYFATPDNFKQFLLYRFGASFILTLLYYLNNLKMNKNYQYMIVIIAMISSAITIELMILSFGGHISSYYAGMNLVIIAVLGLLPFNQSLSIYLSVVIYAIYIIPILLLDRITNLPFFITSNAFIFATFAIALTWRILSHRSMLNELSLQYDLEEEKRKLENYSIHLEDKVVQRTKELSASEERYRALFDNANDGIAVLDRSGVIINVNRKFCEMHNFDRNALIGTHFKLLEIEERRGEKDERVKRLLNGESLLYEAEHYRRDGSRILLEVSSKVIEVGGSLYIQSFHRDITDKKKVQEQLFQSQKMDSLGMLAGGIAHDFKNILTGILGHTEILLENDNLDDASRQCLTTIENTGRKAGNMVSKLLSFSRKSAYEAVPTNINDIVKDVVGLIETTLSKRNMEVEIRLEGNIQLINCNVNQIEQVILNLIINASDAIENKGKITIRTSLLELKDKMTARLYPLLKSERYVILSISDTGRGIPNEIKGKIFDPFFTTKEPGKGTGLGLAMVYGIIKEHNGIIDVKTQVGKGTTFEIYLPVFEEFPIHSRDEEPPIELMSGRENILVVDDESSILSFIKTTLEKQGYRVFATDNPIYAIEIFKQTADDIDIVITDVVMPLIDGRKLIKQIKTVKPSVWVIEISTHDNYGEDKTNRNSDAFLSKPFNGTQLLSAVRKVMEPN
jgi:PAS domain S-box-containing protein